MVIQAQGKTSSSDRHLLVLGQVTAASPTGSKLCSCLKFFHTAPHLGLVQRLAAAHLLHLDSKVVHCPGHHLMPHLHRPLKLQYHVLHIQWWLQRSQLEGVKVVVYAEGHVYRSCRCAPRL